MSSIAIHPTFHLRPQSAPARRAGMTGVTGVRLTRRGRAVVVLVFLAVAFALFTAFGTRSAASGEQGTPVPTRTVVVGEGDTLWRIAGEVAEPGEVREMVHRIVELNALPSVGLEEGQVLAVPAD